MYNFLFYFFYNLFTRLKIDDTIFTSVLWTFIIIGLNIMAFIKLLVWFNVMASMPLFSKIYLYNKLHWFLPLSVVLLIVFLYFNKGKTKKIIEKNEERHNFFTLKNIVTFLATIIVPSFIIAIV